jgi:hypothetical protein
MMVNQQTTHKVERSAKEHRGTPAAPTTTVRRQPKAVNGQAPKATTMKTKPQVQKEHRGSRTFDGANGCKASSTQGAGTKNNVDGATPSPDCDAEHNEQGAEDADPNKQRANEKSQETSRSNERSANESSLSHDSSMQTPVLDTTVSKTVFFQFGKTQKSNLTIIRHPSLS